VNNTQPFHLLENFFSGVINTYAPFTINVGETVDFLVDLEYVAFALDAMAESHGPAFLATLAESSL
jgi:hypothetical protein